MFISFVQHRRSPWVRWITLYLFLCFVGLSLFPILNYSAVVYAQPNLDLPKPGTMVAPTTAFNPPILRGLALHPENPLRFDFIVDRGQTTSPKKELKAEYEKLIKYFLATLAIPEDDLWVNLSPYEKDRIVPDAFGQTEMGRDLLAQDYILKQLMSSLTYPETGLGKRFWDQVYQKAYELYGTTNIPLNTFNKVWIVPDKAVVYENKGKAFVIESHLSVMLEEDYLSRKKNLSNEQLGTQQQNEGDVEQISNLSSQIAKNILIPEIEREVNENKNFAQLRQIYNSMILAVWYKQALQNNFLNKVYSNQKKINGVNADDPQVKEKIYQQYIDAFKMGVYNYIKEDFDTQMKETIPRKYFSGGFDGPVIQTLLTRRTALPEGFVPWTQENMEYLLTDFQSPNPQVQISESPQELLEDQLKHWIEQHNLGEAFAVDFDRLAQELNHSSPEIKTAWESLSEASLETVQPVMEYDDDGNVLPWDGTTWDRPVPVESISGSDVQKLTENPEGKDQLTSVDGDKAMLFSSKLSELPGKLSIGVRRLLARFNVRNWSRVRKPPVPTVDPRFAGITQPTWLPSASDSERIRKGFNAFEYIDPSQNFRGVDLEHFVHAQARLAEGRLAPQILSNLLKNLNLNQNLTTEEAYREIYRALVRGNYQREIIDMINTLPDGRSTYTDPRLDVTIVGQHPNPRAQGINEAVSNSFDAILERLGLSDFKIGQFGMGVKQIIDWLESTGGDRIDIVTRQANSLKGDWYHLTILKDTNGQAYIQIVQLESPQEFEQVLGFPPVSNQGTVVQIKVKTPILRTKAEGEAQFQNSQESMVEDIHRRFAYVWFANITTQIEDEAPVHVNGVEDKRLIVGNPLPVSVERGDIHIAFSAHAVTIIDNGTGMNEQTVSRMFVPKEGDKLAEVLSKEDKIEELNNKVKMVHVPSLPHRVSFARNEEVILAVEIPPSIIDSSTVEGGLMVEFGRLMEVSEKRKDVRIQVDFSKDGALQTFQSAIDHVFTKIIANVSLTDIQKIAYVNTLIVGLEQLGTGNPNYEWVIASSKTKAKEVLSPVIERVEANNGVILPHERKFQKLAVPEGKKVIYLHQDLFDWSGVSSLRRLGGEIIQGVTVGAQKRLPLIVVPFTQESLRGVETFHPDWHTWTEEDRLPIIKTDRFTAIPQRWGKRLQELAAKRIYEGLNDNEKREFAKLTELLNIITGEETTTGYETAAVPKQMEIEEIEEIKRSAGQPDSDAVNEFNSAIVRTPTLAQSKRAMGSVAVPQNANQRHILSQGSIFEIATGKKVPFAGNILALRALRNGYYEIIEDIANINYYKLIRLQEGSKPEEVYYANQFKARLRMSPDEKFVYISRNGDVDEIFNLENGSRFILGANFFEVPAVITQAYKMQFQAPVVPPEIKMSNLQFTADGKYLVYVVKNNKTNEETFVAIDLEKKKPIIQHPILPGEEMELTLSNFGDIVALQVKGDDEIDFFSLAAGKFIPDQARLAFRSDSSGTYTAFRNIASTFVIYFHHNGNMVNASQLNVNLIQSVSTVWSEGDAYYEVRVNKAGTEQILFLDQDGQDVTGVVDPDKLKDKFRETFDGNQLTLFSPGLPGMLPSWNSFDFSNFSPEQNNLIFKQPGLEYFMNLVGPSHPEAIDALSGIKYPFESGNEVVHFFRRESLIFIDGNNNLVRRLNTGDRIEQGKVVAKGKSDPTRSLNGLVVVLDSNSNYVFYNFEKDIPIETILASVSSTEFTNVFWDGQYFVFVNPASKEVVYVSPDDPEHPIRPGQSQAAQSQPTATVFAPTNASLKHVVVNGVLKPVGSTAEILSGVTEFEHLGGNSYLLTRSIKNTAEAKAESPLTPDEDSQNILQEVVHLEGTNIVVLLSTSNAQGKIMSSPNKKYAFIEERTAGLTDSIVNVETGARFLLKNNFMDITGFLPEDVLPNFTADIQNTKNRDLRFSHDGRYLMYREISASNELSFVIVDLESPDPRKIVRKLPQGITDSVNIEYDMNPFANVAFVYFHQNQTMSLVDLTDGAIFTGDFLNGSVIESKLFNNNTTAYQYLHTDSTGTYTAMIKHNGEMEVYVHHGFEIIDSTKVGGKISIVDTSYAGGQQYFTIWTETGNPVRFDQDGQLYQYQPINTDYYYERVDTQGILKGVRVVNNLGQTSPVSVENIFEVNLADLDLLQVAKNIYHHPRYDLVVDTRDLSQPVAIDPMTKNSYKFKGDITYFDQASQKFASYQEGRFSRQEYSGTTSFPQLYIDMRGILDSSKRYLLDTSFGLSLSLSDVSNYSSSNIPTTLSQLEKGSYKPVSFDGKYFVLLNPATGDVIYLDPQDSQNPVRVPADGIAPAPGLVFTPPSTVTAVPGDAKQKYILINHQLIEAGTGKVVFKNAESAELLSNGFYKITTQDEIYISYPERSWNPLFIDKNDGDIAISPDKRFAYIVRKDANVAALIDLQTMVKYELNSFAKVADLNVSPNAITPLSDDWAYRSHGLRFSQSGKYLMYRQLTQGIDYNLVIVDFQKGDVVKKIPYDANSDLFSAAESINPFADVAFIQLKPGNMALLDLSTGEMYDGYKYLRTDSTGTYTVMVRNNDEIEIFFHKSKEVKKRADYGVRIAEISTIYKGDEVYFRLTSDSGDLYELDQDGNLTPWQKSLTGIHLEYYTAFGITLGGINGQVGADPNQQIFPPLFLDFVNASPLQHLNQRGIYFDRTLGLIIDHRYPNNSNAIDPVNGYAFTVSVSDEIAGYNANPGLIVFRTPKGEVVQQGWFNGHPTVATIIQGAIDAVPATYRVIHDTSVGTYNFQSLAQLNDIKMIPGVSPDIYTQILFDGTYFLLINPQTGDLYYVNPSAPENPIFVKAGSGATQIFPTMQLTLDDVKPNDAPYRWTIEWDDQGIPALKDNQGNLTARHPDIVNYVRLNSDTFLAYDQNGQVIEIIRMADPVLARYDLKSLNQTLLTYNDHLAVLTDGVHQFVVDLLTLKRINAIDSDANRYPNLKAGEPNSQEIHLSPSGRFTVHRTETGQLVYYDHDDPHPTPKIILTDLINKEYTVLDNADVVVIKTNAGYSLLNLFTKDYVGWGDTKHVEVDSSGTILVGKVETPSSGNLVPSLYVVNLKDNQQANIFVNLNEVRISSDQKYIYVMVASGLIHSFDRKTGKALPSLPVAPEDLPRYWENYDTQQKTIWDRTSQGVPATWPAGMRDSLKYDDETPFNKGRDSIRLSGTDVMVFNRFDSGNGRSLMSGAGIYDLKTGNDFMGSTLLESIPEHSAVSSLKGGNVRYFNSKEGISKVKVGNQAFDFDPHLTFVNQSKTYLLGQQIFTIQGTGGGPIKGFWMLIDSAEKQYPLLGGIPAGFAVVDVNGDYFVLHNADTGETKYFDPKTIVNAKVTQGIPAQQDAGTRVKWNQEVVTRREAWVKRVQSIYQPILELINSGYGEYNARGEINRRLAPLFDELYRAQLREVRARFERAVREGKDFDATASLPFDRFAGRMARLKIFLDGFLNNTTIRDFIRKEEYSYQRDFYVNLFSGLFELAVHWDLSFETVMEKLVKDSELGEEVLYRYLFELLGYGFKVGSQEQLSLIPKFGELIDRLNQITNKQMKLVDLKKILDFLFFVADKGPQNIETMNKQLDKILRARPQTMERFLAKWLTSFASVELADLTDFINHPDSTRALGDARSFASFLTSDGDQVREESSEEKAMFLPEGEDVDLERGGTSLARIAEEEERRPKDDQYGNIVKKSFSKIGVEDVDGLWQDLVARGYIDETQSKVIKKLEKESDVVLQYRFMPYQSAVYRVLQEARKIVMDVDYFIEHRHQLPGAPQNAQMDLVRDSKVQRESGAYTAELTQNSKDARASKLEISYYLRTNQETGKREFVEEIADDGTGLLQEFAMWVARKSTKEFGAQQGTTGFFGTGGLTTFEGVDRLELINNNGIRRYMFVVDVIKDENGNFIDFKLVRMRKITNPNIREGVTVRRVKAEENTIPELDQMLSQRTWKIFTGLAQTDDFKIYFVNYTDNVRRLRQLNVDSKVVSEIDFTIPRFGDAQMTTFGQFRLIATKDMPLQVVDRVGLRVSEIPEPYLKLVPPGLRRHIKELGLNLQIPLPMIRGRSDFEHGDTYYLPYVQKYVAIELFKLIAQKTLSETDPQFTFLNFPTEWRSNDHYWKSIDFNDAPVVRLAQRINDGQYNEITPQELLNLISSQPGLDYEKKVLKLILMLKAPVQGKTTSLLLERIAIQEELDRNRQGRDLARRNIEMLEDIGLRVNRADIPDVRTIAGYQEILRQASGIETGHEQMKNPAAYLVNPDEYTNLEKELIASALQPGKLVGIERVLLTDNRVFFEGAFSTYENRKTMFLRRGLASHIGRSDPRLSILDEATNTIDHELAHLLEQYMVDFFVSSDLWTTGLPVHLSNFTHDRVGTFAESMKYMAAIWLTNSSDWEEEAYQGADRALLKSSDDLNERFLTNLEMQLPLANVAGRMPVHAISQAAKSIGLDHRPDQRGSIMDMAGQNKRSPPGGIDLNPAHFNLQVQGQGTDGAAVPNEQNLEIIPINGLTPVILQITPVTDLPFLLGLSQPAREQLSYSAR